MRFRHAGPLLVVALLTWACGAVGDPAPGDAPAATVAALSIEGPGRVSASIVTSGSTRSFEMVVPDGLDSPAALVLVLHGFAGSPSGVEALSGLTEIAEREGFVVVYPRAAGLVPAWAVDPRLGSADVRFLGDLVEAVGDGLPIDRSRVFVAGMSNGGGMAARFACESPDVVAAVAAVAAAHAPDGCVPTEPTATIAFHGTADPIVPIQGRPPISASIEEWAEERRAANRCDPDPGTEVVAPDVTLERWTGCDAGADTELYVIDGGGHGWPGSARAASSGDTTTSIVAGELIWSFFAAHPHR